MKHPTAPAFVLALALGAGAASAPAQALDEGGFDDGYYDEARVVQVVPVVGEHCITRDEGYRGHPGGGDYYTGEPPPVDNGGRAVATVLGSLVGAVIGSKVGEGSGRYVASAIGSTVGGMAGREIYDQAQRQRASVTVCDPAAPQYEVTYEYGGRTHVTRTSQHPGERIRIRVDVRAE